MERLKRFSLFQDMTDRDLAEISRDATFNQFEKGEVLVSGADMGRNLHLLLEGRVRLVTVGRSGREIVLESVGPGEIFGERAGGSGSSPPPYPLAVAEERCHVLTIPFDALKNYFERFPLLSYRLARALAEKVAKMDRRLLQAEEDRDTLYAIVGHKDREADVSYQSHTATRFFRQNEQKIRRLAEDGGPVLITGESGVGKYQLGRLVFRNSPSLNRIFLYVNFYNPDTLRPEGGGSPQSEEEILFGRASGGTYQPGLIDLARGGTLLIMGLDRLSAGTQERLLGLIDGRSAAESPSGARAKPPLRLLFGAREDLKTLEARGGVVPDLARLLAERTLSIPPLRDRKKDLPALIDFYVRKYSAELGRAPALVPEETLKVLLDHSWPGNEGELAETLKRGLVLAGRGVLQPEDIHLDFNLNPAISPKNIMR